MKYIGAAEGWTRAVPTALAVVLVAASAAAAHPGTWTAGDSLDAKRYLAATAEVDSVIYVIGGSEELDVLDTVWAYDPGTRTWQDQARASMPTPRSLAAVAVVDGKIYVIGGSVDDTFTTTAAVEAYDPATDTWESLTEMGTARWGAAAAAVDGMIYVFGGGTGDVLGNRSLFSIVEVYDPATDTWDMAAEMPGARGLHAAAVVDGLVYTIGGKFEDVREYTGGVEIYDPATDTWATGADMPTPRDAFAAAVVGDMIYVIGGLAIDHYAPNVGFRVAHEVEVYDFRSDAWERVGRMPDPRWGIGSAVVDGTIHLIGGSRGLVTSGHHRVDSYDPDLYTSWTEVAAHLPGSYGSQWRTDFCAINESAGEADVEVVLHTETGDHTFEAAVGGGQQKSFADIVGSMEIEGKGTLEVRSNEPLRLAGRIYSEDESGTFGQACGFHPMDAGFAVGDTAWLVGLRQEEGLYRTNLTVANTGIRNATAAVKLFACDGTEVGTFAILAVPPGGLIQDLEPFANCAGQPDLGWGYATVEVVSGAGVRISASVIDSRTNDATTIVAER